MTNSPYTLRDFFAQSGLPLLEAKMLAEQALGVSRAWMIAHDLDELSESQWHALTALRNRRIAGEPMAYIMGSREFMGLDFTVSPAVLIPRPDTETLVEAALGFLKDKVRARVLDMGTGSGAIALSIAHFAPHTQVFASDISQDALAIAKVNAEKFKLDVDFRQSSWFDQFCGETFHLIVSNPPYIHQGDEHLSQGDLRFEPRLALTDNADGLSCYRTIIQQAPRHLTQGGAIYLEHGWNQAEAVRALLIQAGFAQVCSIRDLAGIERVSGGVWLAE